ncbi:MAG: hypothetical protein DRJ03_02130 [Chloroflexi bacterium]|nr:MAG: hypothetical protein DRJ03_02130 [Chloroflexota bacterium]
MNPYEIGVKLALDGVGLTKTAIDEDSTWIPTVFGPLGAVIAPEGKGWEAAGKILGGNILGGVAGSVGGFGAGAGLGALIGLLGKNPGAGAEIGALLGGKTLGSIGSMYGGYKGYRSAVPE